MDKQPKMGKSDSAERKIKDKLRPRIAFLVVTLCLATGMLIGTAPAYAQQKYGISVGVWNLGPFHCADVISNKKQVGTTSKTITANNGAVSGTIDGGTFSVDFFSTRDCSGKPGKVAPLTTTTDAAYSCDVTQKPLCQRIE